MAPVQQNATLDKSPFSHPPVVPTIHERQVDGRLEAGIDWQIARRRKGIRAIAEGPMKELLSAAEKTKAQVRGFVEL